MVVSVRWCLCQQLQRAAGFSEYLPRYVPCGRSPSLPLRAVTIKVRSDLDQRDLLNHLTLPEPLTYYLPLFQDPNISISFVLAVSLRLLHLLHRIVGDDRHDVA